MSCHLKMQTKTRKNMFLTGMVKPKGKYRGSKL